MISTVSTVKSEMRDESTHAAQNKVQPTTGERFDANTEVQKISFTQLELLLDRGVTLKKVPLFSIVDRKDRLRARNLFFPAKADLLMFPQCSYDGVSELKAHGLEADLVEITGNSGHLDSLANAYKVADRVRDFLGS